jgi:hypothetical protein
MPFEFPVMLLPSIRLPLLVPMRPTPKSLLDVTVGVAPHSAVAQTEPLPPKRLFRMRLLWLLTRHDVYALTGSVASPEHVAQTIRVTRTPRAPRLASSSW